MNENMICVLVENARSLMKNIPSTCAEKDFDAFVGRIAEIAVNATDAIQRITHSAPEEAAELFLAMVNSDEKRDAFIAQAFVAQPAGSAASA